MEATANTLKVVKWVMKGFTENAAFSPHFTRDYESELIKSDNDFGSIINARLPRYYKVADGNTLVIQENGQKTVPIKINYRKNLGLEESIMDVTTQVNLGPGKGVSMKRDLYEIGKAFATDLDLACAAQALNVSNCVGDPTSSVSTLNTVTELMEKLLEQGNTMDGMRLAVTPNVSNTIASSLVRNGSTPFFDEESARLYKKTGFLGSTVQGFDLTRSNNVYKTTTAGTAWSGATVTIAGSLSAGDTIYLKGFTTTRTIKAGTVFTVGTNAIVGAAKVNAYNVVNHQPTGSVQQFVVTQDTAASGTLATVKVSPSIVTSGAYQNCDVTPPNGATVVVASGTAASGTVAHNLAWKPEAFALCMCKFAPVEEAGWSQSFTLDGFTITATADYDHKNFRRSVRFDIMAAIATIQAAKAGRIVSSK